MHSERQTPAVIGGASVGSFAKFLDEVVVAVDVVEAVEVVVV